MVGASLACKASWCTTKGEISEYGVA